MRGHYARDRLREAIADGRDRLMARTYAIKPVAHVTGRHVVDAHGGERIVWQKQEMFLALLVDVGIVFVVAMRYVPFMNRRSAS